MAVLLLLPGYTHVILIFLLLYVGDCHQVEPNFCDSSCSGFTASDFSYQKGMRYTYRYTTTINTTTLSSSGRNGLTLDCVVDLDVVSKCHLMMQIRNPQIKRLSPQREHSVLHLKKLRETLERARLKFSLQGGKVTALCFQEGEQVWALNIKRALLSMLQTSPMVTKFKEEKETDIHGTCTSRYERRGSALVKTRDLKRCQQSRLASFWPHSVTLSEDTSVQMDLRCVQRHGATVMEEVNCTEIISVGTGSGPPGLVKTQTVSTLILLRAQPGHPSGAESLGIGVLTDLQFVDEGTSEQRQTSRSTPQAVAETVRLLCSLSSDPQLVSQEFIQLVFQLKHMTLSQLKTLWREASFKCRNDWQPVLDALPACGSENCILLLTDLIMNKELEEGLAHSYLTTISLIPHPSSLIIGSITALLEDPELRFKALLAGSSLTYQLCQRSPTPCTEIPQVQEFIRKVETALKVGCEEQKTGHAQELFYALKSVGNTGLSASVFIPLLNRCILDQRTSLELRLTAIQAFRRFPCSADRSVLLQLYGSSLEDTEVRITAYQQLMLCPDQRVFEVVKTTLRSETSSQVGSFVWSHLTNVLRSEDPTKQALIESLPDDIISRDFEAEFLKYSSYSDNTYVSGIGIKNVETSLIFSPKSFLPSSASANLTVYFHGKAHNLLEVDLHVENAEPLLRKFFDYETESESTAENGRSKVKRSSRKTDDGDRGEKERCFSTTNSFLNQAQAMLFGRRKTEENRLKCWLGVKVFGNEVSVFTCDDIYHQMDQVSLSMAGLAVKLLKGQEVQMNHRALLTPEDLVLPSLSGLPMKLGVNMTSLLSLRLKGSFNYRDPSHFSLNGYIKPNAFVGLSARMGVDSVLGQAAVEWAAELKSSTSLDGSIQLQEGRDIRVMLNTPEDTIDIFTFSYRVFQVSGDHRAEIKGPKSQVQKTACTPKTWSKIIGWQLCSNSSLPPLATGLTFPPSGPVNFSLRLLKLDRGLHYYLLEAAYSLHHQKGTWLPREASVHLVLATPQSSIPRDMSLDLAFNPHRVLLRITHPLKTIHIEGQLEQERNIKSGKLELVIDSARYYVMGLVDTHSILSEQRTRCHFEAKMAANEHPMILSANITRGLGRKTSFSATLKNVFRETASLSVALERRRDSSGRQYSVEADVLLPGVVGSRMLGLMEQRRSLWSSVFRLKYGLGGNARQLRQECYTSQRLRSERDSNLTYIMRADHEFYCTNTATINHKIHLRHEESPSHIKSSFDMSYGPHWDEINNKKTILLSQSFKNQSTKGHTSYTLEFNFQAPEKNLNYRTQLMHSHVTQFGSESSTHLKINYNNLMPLVAGLHWKSTLKDSRQKKWEGTLNMDSPWLYIYTTHKLSHLHRHALQLTSGLTVSKWLSIRNLVLEAFYRGRGRDREARLKLFTPAATYLQAGVWGVVGKQGVKASGSFSSLWTLPLRGNISVEASKLSHTLQMSTTYGKQNVSFVAALNTADKDLKKRQVILKMSVSNPKSSPSEVELEGAVEELKKDKNMYQKTAMLHLRQPFQNLPQSLLLRETFTVDLLKGVYILETKASILDNREILHTLTLGHKPLSPFVCCALIHPFRSDTIPSDTEICVNVTSTQTQKDVRGRLRVGSKERLAFFGQAQINPLHSSRQAIKVKANLIHQLQLRLPSSAIIEGEVCWKPKDKNEFDYQARGKLKIERQECRLSVQLNGTSGKVNLLSSISHPFKSKTPKILEVKATADVSVPGKGSSSVSVKADGKDRVILDAQMSHSVQKGDRAAGLRMNLSQSLLPTATNLNVNIAANMSSDRVFLRGSFAQGQEALLLQVKGSLKRSRGFQLAVSGDFRHSMTSLNLLPTVLGLDGVFRHVDALIEGQLRTRLTETVHVIDLRHQWDAGKSSDVDGGEDKMGEKFQEARDWLCLWSGAEHVCLNVSWQLTKRSKEPRGGEVFGLLSHSFHALDATGIPTNSSAQLMWTLDDGQLSVLTELLAGPEYLKAEIHRARTDHLIPRWEYFSRFQHQVKALQKRGISSSFQAEAHYQLETAGLDTGLILYMEDQRIADVLFKVGSENKTTVIKMSLWQQIKQLQELIPTSLQMSCTGDKTADRLSAHCYGNVTDRPVEVRVFRSYRPHNRFCYGLSITHFSLSAQAKACYSSNGQKELRANLTHSSVLLLANLGMPDKSGLRLILRPGPNRWVMGIGTVFGSWRTDLSARIRIERLGLYSWHGHLEYGSHGVIQNAAAIGRIRLESLCNIWARASVEWNTIASSLLVSIRCTGVGKLVWMQVGNNEGVVPHQSSLTLHGQAGKDGLKGSMTITKQQDSLQTVLSVLLKDQKADVVWSLLHHWKSITSFIPERVELHVSGQTYDTSFSGTARLSVDTRFLQANISGTQGPSTSLRVMLRQNVASGSVQDIFTITMLTTASQARFLVESDACSIILIAKQHKGKKDSRNQWRIFAHQQCTPQKTSLLPQASVNISVTHSECFTNLSSVLEVEGIQKGSLSVSLTCHPHLTLRASVVHSVEAIKTSFPDRGELLLNFSTVHQPEMQFCLQLGQCYLRGNMSNNIAPQKEFGPSSYTFNVTSYCPLLKERVLPVFLALRGGLSVTPCQVMVSSSLRADNQDLSLELNQSCRSPHLSGTLRHSFPGLESKGLPENVIIEATAPGGPGEAGDLYINVGTCNIRATTVKEARGRRHWLWTLESKCPVYQAHLNGSVWRDPQGIWSALFDADAEGRRAFLRLDVKPWPELRVEGELSHDGLAFGHLPKNSRLRLTSRSVKPRRDMELLVVTEECAVRASGAVMSLPGLQGSLVYNNNCTTIQEWGSPYRMQASGSLAVSLASINSQISMVVDDTALQTLMAIRKTEDQNEASLHLNQSLPLLEKLGFPMNASLKIHSGSHSNGSYFHLFSSSVGEQKLSQAMTVAKTSETVRVKSDFRHTLNYLMDLGVPALSSIQMEFGAAKEKALTFQCLCGDHQAGLRLHVKSVPLIKEIRGNMWHSWSWLHDQGLPLNIEGLCFIKGTLSELQSRAQLSVAGHKLLASGLNVSGTDGHLSALVSYSPSPVNQTRILQKLDSVLTAQFKGSQRSALFDVRGQDWRVHVAGDTLGWQTHGGTKEGKITLKHTLHGKIGPALQIEAWGRLTESQLRCSMAVNPESSSSVALIIQGHHSPRSKDLAVKAVHNLPRMLVYLPSQFSIRSQLNQSLTSVAGLLEVLSGRRRLWARGELTTIESGYRHAVEVKHSYPQLRPLPRTIGLRTVYESRDWSYQVQQAAVWGNHEFSLSGLYSDPPMLEIGNQTLKVQISCVPRVTSLEVMLERSPEGRLGSVLLGWMRHGQLEQVRALSAWSRTEERNETKLELKQPFSSTLSQLSVYMLSYSSQREQHSSHQTQLSWDGTAPGNVSLSLNKQWQTNSSRGQACALLSAQQMAMSPVKGCVSLGQEGNSYLQHAELKWDNRSVKQGIKYQKGLRGMHSLQVHVGLDRVSPAPCPSHTLLAKVQTNLRDRLEHMVLLGVCPPHPTLSWSGSHRVSSGQELFYTQSRFSAAGRPYQCSFTLSLTNSSAAQMTNVSLFSESSVGNWSVEIGGSAMSWPRGSGLQIQATVDHREMFWLNGSVEGRCLQTTAGFMNGSDISEDLKMAACAGANSLRMEVQRRDQSRKPETLATVSLGSVNRRLQLKASGCLQSLTSAEERLHYLGYRIRNRLAERIKTLQHLLIEFRKQSSYSEVLQEWSAAPLRVSQRAEELLRQGERDLLSLWRTGPLRHLLTSGLPRFLRLLQDASALGQQELRRPLATLAGVYQDVKGQSLEEKWREALVMWSDWLVDALPFLLDNPHLRPLSQAGVTVLRALLDVAGQHTYHWTENRLATALSGLRKRLASVYKLSPRDCAVTVSVPLPPLASPEQAEAGVVEILLEEWLLRPLQALASVRPAAELYRFKRKIMDSPFIHRALLVADQFVVTFDGHLYELPGLCPLLLARDVSGDPSFTLMLARDSQNFLLVHMNNSTISIQHGGQVKADCNKPVTHTYDGDGGLTVRRGPNFVHVANQNGASVSCDLSLELCSFILDGWLHGASTGLLGTNDNDAGNDFPLPDGSQANTLEDFFYSWQLQPKCGNPPDTAGRVSQAATSTVTCASLFSSHDSPLSLCFRVVDPGQFLSVCELSSSRAPCRLASAFVHLCQQNYIPVEVPVQCFKV